MKGKLRIRETVKAGAKITHPCSGAPHLTWVIDLDDEQHPRMFCDTGNCNKISVAGLARRMAKKLGIELED